MKRPWQCYQAGSQKFLGYEQAWDTLLAALVYCKTLHLESSVGRNQPIGEDDDCNAPMMLLQNELGAIQPVIQEMLDMIMHLTKLFSWPGIPPSLCYSIVTSRGAYLHTLWDYGPYHELIRLSASCLVCWSLPIIDAEPQEMINRHRHQLHTRHRGNLERGTGLVVEPQMTFIVI